MATPQSGLANSQRQAHKRSAPEDEDTPMSSASNLDASQLPIQLEESQAISPAERAWAKKEAAVSATGMESRRTPYTVDPAIKGAKFYGVRRGRQRGVSYSGQVANKQIVGYRGRQMMPFDTKDEVEHFMNHAPEDCKYSVCRLTCEQAAANNKLKKLLDNPDSNQCPAFCKCCGNSFSSVGKLCKDCFVHPDKWMEHVAQAYELDDYQKELLGEVAAGANVVITGSAGNGKSRLTQAIVHYLRGMGLQVEVAAPSSLPASKIGGRTLKSTMRSYIGWHENLDSLSMEDLISLSKEIARHSLTAGADALVMDEVSMLSSNALTRLSTAMSAAVQHMKKERAGQPFGGAQVIFSADFHQLAPLDPFARCLWCGCTTNPHGEGGDRAVCLMHGDFDLNSQYAFSSPIWKACNFEIFTLITPHRHDNSDLMLSLENFRLNGIVTQRARECLGPSPLDHVSEPDDEAGGPSGSRAVTLYSKVQDASALNRAVTEKLQGQIRAYRTHDNFLCYSDRHDALLGADMRSKDCLVALNDHELLPTVELKTGMLVVLMADLGSEMQSGAVGTIVDWVPIEDENMPRAEENCPWGGDLGYTLFGPYRHYQQAQIKQFCDALPPKYREWPVVQFEDDTLTIYAACLVSELGISEPYSLLSRTQIPLVPGYGMTIQRSQGLTLDRILIDSANMVEDARPYVALSRARDVKSMIVKSLPHETSTRTEVREFYREVARSRGEVLPAYLEDDEEDAWSASGDDVGGDGDVEMTEDGPDPEIEEVADGMHHLQLEQSSGSRKRVKTSH